MANHEDRKINRFLCVSGAGLVQVDANTPVPTIDLDTRDKCDVTLSEVINRRITRDCKDRYPIKTQITDRLLRVALNYTEVTPQIMYRWLAIFLGASTAPTGAPANEVQRLSRSGTVSGGTFTLAMTLEGRLVTTKPIAWNATISQVIDALTAARMLYIQPGDVTGVGGTPQAEDLTVVGTCTGDGNLPVTVTAANSPALAAGKTINVAILDTDTATIVAGKIRVALAADTDVNGFFVVSGATTHVILTARAGAANDVTMAVSNTAVLGMTAATSANSTAGVADWGAPGITLTFARRLARANLPQLVVDNALITGGGSILNANVTNGNQNFHTSTRSVSDVKLLTGFALGWDDVTDRVEIYAGFAVESWNPTVNRDGNAGLQVSLIGPWEPDSIPTDFDIPDCINIDPLLAQDCSLLVDGNIQTTDVNSETITLNDNVPIDRLSAFGFDSVDVQRLQRGNQPADTISMGVFGTEVDAIYQLAYLERTEDPVPVIARFGMPGNRCTVLMPLTKIQFQGNRWAFVGGLQLGVVQLEGTAYASAPDTPVSAEAYLDQATAFLLTS